MTKKIMFNDRYGLTQAVLEGRKTQTRRIVPQSALSKISLFQEEYQELTFDNLEGIELINHYYFVEKQGKLPFQIGETVAVAQSYKEAINQLDWVSRKLYEGTSGWNNKMFVRADLMPHQIRIADMRVQRLQDISDEDCIKEGLKWSGKARLYYVGYNRKTGARIFLNNTPRDAYAVLIDKISGKGTWDSNPYVFVYDFELVK